jgi:hypothetical protein
MGCSADVLYTPGAVACEALTVGAGPYYKAQSVAVRPLLIIAPAQHLCAYRVQIGFLRALSRLPHNTLGMCLTVPQLPGRTDRGSMGE